MYKKSSMSVFNTLNMIFMAAVVLLTAYPFYYVIIYSLSQQNAISNGFLFFPKGFNLDAYKTVFNEINIFGAISVSVLRSTIGPLLALMFTSMVAFSISRRDLAGRKFFNVFFIVTLYINAGLIPIYLLYKNLHMIGTFYIYILPYLLNAFNMLIIKSYMENLPAELFESANIDGANDLQVYARIIMPLCKPVLSAVGLFECVNQWNMFFDTMIFNTMQRNLYTLQYVLVNFVTSKASQIESLKGSVGVVDISPMSLKMAITVIVVLPIMLVYPMLQRYFAKGLLIGAIKG